MTHNEMVHGLCTQETITMSPHHRELFNAYFKEQFKAVYHMSVEEAWAKFGTE